MALAIAFPDIAVEKAVIDMPFPSVATKKAVVAIAFPLVAIAFPVEESLRNSALRKNRGKEAKGG
jgi:hypothetical protein